MHRAYHPRVERTIQIVGLVLAATAIATSAAGILAVDSRFVLALPFLTLTLSAALIFMLLRESRTQAQLRVQADILRQKVRETEEKNRWLNLTEASAHVGHWRLDLRTDEVYWSDETARIHGLEPGFAPELPEAINLFHPDDRGIVGNAIETARDTGVPFVFKARLLRPDGAIRHAESIARMELDQDGNPAVLFGIFADRTEEEMMRAELRDARDEARALADSKSAFLAKMSHEIRTPMNGVLGFAELLLTSELDETQRRHADLIAESGRNLQALLNDILDLSKIEAGHMVVQSKPTDIVHLLRSCKRLAEPTAREKGLQLDCEIDSGVPVHLMLDPLRLRQVVNNLLSNALRYTDAGRICLSAGVRGDQLVINVTDTGIGIDPRLQQAIFDPFIMADDADQQSRGGIGLGLPICRQLTELMGGTLAVQSALGSGSNFTARFPLVEAPIGHEKVVDAAERAQLDSGWADAPVLLVEDFDVNRELVSEMGKRLEIEIHEACDGSEAVSMIRTASREGRPYALVLMDLQMPVMDGFAATRQLRAEGFDEATLPIIALTANAFADDIERCRQNGMQEHLSKPISFAKFENAMQRWLPAGPAHAA